MKRSLCYLLPALFAAVVLFSCKDDDKKITPALELSTNAENPGNGATTRDFTVTSNTKWSAESNQTSWCTVSPETGNGNGTVTITIAANETTEARVATITVKTTSGSPDVEKKITVTQAAGETPNTLTLTDETLDFEGDEDSQNFTVVSNTNWSVESDQTWCTVSPATGDGEEEVTVTVEANEGTTERTATITVKTTAGTPELEETITITQAPLPEPTLTLSETELSFDSAGGTKTFNVTSNTKWIDSSNQTWCTVTPTNDRGNKPVTITVAANTTYVERTATITVVTDLGTPEVTKTITIKQAAALPAPTLTTSTTALNYDNTAGSKTFDVTSNTDWSVSSNQTWCTFSPATDNGNKTVTVTVTANTGTSRTATITVTTTSGTPVQTKTISVTQDAPAVGDNLADRITMSGTGDDAKLVITRDYTTAGLYFRWGSIVGIYSDTGSKNAVLPASSAAGSDGVGNWDASGADVAFNPTTISCTTYASVPYTTGVEIQHTLENMQAGKGDPCRLVGYTIKEIKEATEVLDNKEWRMPSQQENMDFTGVTTTGPTSDNVLWFWPGADSPFSLVQGYEYPAKGSGVVSASRIAHFLPNSGQRNSSGKITNLNNCGYYWSSTLLTVTASSGIFQNPSALTLNQSFTHTVANAVRCVKQQ